MSAHATISPPARNWRDIPQSIAPRAMSSTGRKRMIFATSKSIAVLVVACACLIGGYEIFRTWQHDPAKLKAPVKSSVVKNISLRGQNLVLDQPWVMRTLALSKNADLMELDLFALRERLLASGQVKAAVLTRKFPDTLLVSLEERSPVARVSVRFGEGEPQSLLVARDGVVYQGSGYTEDTVKSLPFLGGMTLRRASGRLLPIEGMEVVADLLSTARVNAANLYHNWAVVSLEKYATDGQIIVHSSDSGEVIFGTREDFYKQIARLDYILDESHKNATALPLKTVNLAVGEQVPVSFELPPADAIPTHKPSASSKPSSLNPARIASPVTARPGVTHAAPTRPLQANSASNPRSPRRDF